jgi:uncharacterized protein YdcH (DUF465 family)
MGLFSERHDLVKQLNAAEARLESVQGERNSLADRVRRLEHEAQLLGQRERTLREAMEFLVNNCSAEPDGPWATALQMARAALSATEPER